VKKVIFISLFCFITSSVFSQTFFRARNYNFEPIINQTSDGIWGRSYDSIDLIAADSVYIVNKGFPDYGDITVPDLELKVKALWSGSKIFFLFQRMDDVYVTGYNDDSSPDASVKEGLENRDATCIYFYLSTDSARTESSFDYSDSIAWIRFVWKTDDVMARLPSGDTVNSYEEFHSEYTQWCDDTYCYSKISIDLGELAPYIVDSIQASIDSFNYAAIGFNIELDENDKEDGVAPFGIQTRAFWTYGMADNALDHVDKWKWLVFYQDTLTYTTGFDPVVYISAIYPNPANSQITIKLKEYKEINYSLVDLSGRVFLNGYFESNEHTIPVSDLYNGMYILQLTDKKGNQSVAKVMVMH